MGYYPEKSLGSFRKNPEDFLRLREDWGIVRINFKVNLPDQQFSLVSPSILFAVH
jgi:hypothetical protein